nr:hypothetical protein GCM10017611_55390 [Rhodococcus wratislaviensis]
MYIPSTIEELRRTFAELAEAQAEARRRARNEIRPREDRLRRTAARLGLRLTKSRSRTPGSYEYGTYGLRDIETNAPMFSDGYGFTLDGVETALTGEDSSTDHRSTL